MLVPHPEGDEPQPGFDHWVSFKGQGTYLPSPAGLNVDGQQVAQRGYITDELTDYALKWLEGRKGDKPFLLFLSHKAVHSDFVPAERHQGRYATAPFRYPATMAPPADQLRLGGVGPDPGGEGDEPGHAATAKASRSSAGSPNSFDNSNTRLCAWPIARSSETPMPPCNWIAS